MKGSAVGANQHKESSLHTLVKRFTLQHFGHGYNGCTFKVNFLSLVMISRLLLLNLLFSFGHCFAFIQTAENVQRQITSFSADLKSV